MDVTTSFLVVAVQAVACSSATFVFRNGRVHHSAASFAMHAADAPTALTASQEILAHNATGAAPPAKVEEWNHQRL